MSASFVLPLLWGQVPLAGSPGPLRKLLSWLFVFGDPMYMINPATTSLALLSGLVAWLKVVSLVGLVGWVVTWVFAAMRERHVARGTWLDIAGLVALVGGAGAMLLHVLEDTKRIPVYKIGGVYSVRLLAALSLAVIAAWVEYAVWSTVRRLGRRGDLAVLFGMHVALALGLLVGFEVRSSYNRMVAGTTNPAMDWTEALTMGVRLSATFMGYVVLLKVAGMLLVELVSLRWRRLYAIARVTVTEANRRMWAPWVVAAVFLVILAFTHWFLQPPRAAEIGRLYVGTLSLLCSLLLTVMVTLLTPLSLPQDIQNQTIYTVVSKPVRRIELVWGRVLGFMGIVTVLVLVFGGVSLMYLSRTVGGTITATENLAAKALRDGRTTEARQLYEQADQIRTRMAARVPVFGSLSFLDSKGEAHIRGIDVGQEQSMREPRSHIEGATPAAAIWTYGVVVDPVSPPDHPILLDRRIPVDQLLVSGTIEDLQNRAYRLAQQVAAAERPEAVDGDAAPTKDRTAALARNREEQKRLEDSARAMKAQADGLEARAAAAEKAGKAAEAQELRRQAAALHSPPVAVEMTFNVYRTTKGRVGEPVFAKIDVKNLGRTGDDSEYHNIFPIREYYTNRQAIPASVLAGSNGSLRVEVRCVSPTQYLGMAEHDLFLLARSGDFGTNFMKGLFGIWLQALVLTAIGVFAGTFLSWPVALLTTIFFFVAGQVAFAFLVDFTRQNFLGGGPFESLIRLLTHDNQMSELAPTLPVVTAKTFDALVMPVMSRLVYVVPNFAALDVTNTVADGFAVSWPLLFSNLLLALAYALPFSVAGYFILKNREVAA